MNSVEDFADVKVCAQQLIMKEDFVDEFVCKICLVHVVGCGPQLTKCSHLFCGDCLQKWFSTHPSTGSQRAKSGGVAPCPVCKTFLSKETDVYPVEKHGSSNSTCLWRMIQELKIKCDGRYGARGFCCAWKGTCGSYKNHVLSGACGRTDTDAYTRKYDESISDERSPSLGKTMKESRSSSTCSEISGEFPLEELQSDSDSEAEKFEDLRTSTMNRSTSEPAGENLTSLIQDLLNLKASEKPRVALNENMNSVLTGITQSPIAGNRADINESGIGTKTARAKTSQPLSKYFGQGGREVDYWQSSRLETSYVKQYQQYQAIQAVRMQLALYCQNMQESVRRG